MLTAKFFDKTGCLDNILLGMFEEFFKDDSSVELELRKERLKKLESIRQKGKDPFPEKFENRLEICALKNKFGELLGNCVRVAGRIYTIREHGKITFCDLLDGTGKIQIYLSVSNLEDYKEIVKGLDIGDIVGVEGIPFYTKRGEPTVEVKKFVLLAKAVRPFPEKWHGLKDVEIRYRRRYLDFIVNPEVKKIFEFRSRFIKAIRDALYERGFIEIETPIMQIVPGGAVARPFVTHHNALDLDLYLRIAPELYLKRLVVGGFEKIFELGKNFRNEGISNRHNPEFTMLEVYQAYATYEDMMKLAEQIVWEALQKCQEAVDRFKPPWPRLRWVELLKKFAGLDFENGVDWEAVSRKADELGVKAETPKKSLDHIFEQLVQPNLKGPLFVIDYPVEISPLAKRAPDNPKFVHRFEIFIDGIEIGNAYSELNDPIDQAKRFLEQRETEEELSLIDWDFVRALEYGMPPTGGLGIGIDRLIMVLKGASNIKEVILFPLLKPKE